MREIVRASGIKHVFSDGTNIELKDTDFSAKIGEKIAILGCNGSGKSTFLNMILGIISPLEGVISVFGVEPSKSYNKIWHKIGAVFQNVDEQIIGPTVWDDIAFSMRNYGYKIDEIDNIVEKILKEIGIYQLKDKIPHYLSGGEKKKVAIAGALAMNPQLLLLDEPFEGLDTRSKKHIIELLLDKNQKNEMTIIFTSHDYLIAQKIADKIYHLEK